MNNRIYLVLIIVLSCVLLLVGAGLIGAALYLQGGASAVAGFSTPSSSNALISPDSVAGAPKVGELAPDFTVTTVTGENIKLSDFHGKPVIVNFWASWCGPCTAEMKNIESVYQKHTNDDIVILAVNQGEGNDTIKGFGELWKLNFRLVRDPDEAAGRAFRVQALPTTVFIDSDGKVYEVHIGGPMTVDFIEKRVNDLLAKAK